MHYSVSQTGILLGVCAITIRRWYEKGLIKCIQILGGHRRISKDGNLMKMSKK